MAAPFSRSILPHLRHPSVVALGPEAQQVLMRRALARYLHATTVLESRVVNPMALEIAEGATPFEFDDDARFGAWAIYRDEGEHALMAAELLHRLGLEREHPQPAFLSRLDRLRQADRGLVTLLFTVGTETLLSATLVAMSRDPSVLPEVRRFAIDHARDEARHSAWFGARFADLWPQLDSADRDRYGPMMPQLLRAFLEPDQQALRADLRAVGLEDGLESADQAEAMRVAVRPTVTCLERAGAMTGPTLDAFRRARLVA